MKGRNDVVNCSSCGCQEGLHMVIIPYEENRTPGRVLVYCGACREVVADRISEAIPLAKVSRGVFLDLYRSGKTASDPFTAVELVFGRSDTDLVREAQGILNASNGGAR